MRAHWFDIGVVLVVVVLEFKGLLLPFLPVNPGLDKLRSFIYRTETNQPPSYHHPKPKSEPQVYKQEKMSAAVPQIIKNHISSNKVAVSLLRMDLYISF